MQGKYDEAKPLYERSLRIREINLGELHPDVAESLNTLANILIQQVMCVINVGMASPRSNAG